MSDISFITDHVAYDSAAQIKPKSFEWRRNFFFLFFFFFFFFFYPGRGASYVYVGAWALGCFHSLISLITQNLREALNVSVDSCAKINGVTSSGRVWRKVPESGARSVGSRHTPSITFRHLQMS